MNSKFFAPQQRQLKSLFGLKFSQNGPTDIGDVSNENSDTESENLIDKMFYPTHVTL